MSFSKTLKGTFDEVRVKLERLAQEVVEEDAKTDLGDTVKEGHALQAFAAAHALEEILARVPHLHNKEGQQISVALYGSANTDGRGSFGGSYTFETA